VQCEAAEPYFASVKARREREVDRLAQLTGWAESDIRDRMRPLPPHFDAAADPEPRDFLDRVRDWFME